MTQREIPFVLMRGGTSRGPYFLRSDLPSDEAQLAEILATAVGAGHPNNIDGLGGGVAVTTKVAMLSRSDDPDADVDYFFAQVAVDKRQIDTKPTCGNILVGVGPAAIEMGLIEATDPQTTLRIRAVNTGALVEAVVQTPGGVVSYAGDLAIDGVAGTAAPVSLNFLRVVGSRTGKMFPTGARIDTIDGVEVSCVDVTMPMMIARATDLGITGYESRDVLEADTALFARMEALRIEAGRRMGLGDVSASVTPKLGLIAPPRDGGHFCVRYFMPWSAHPTLAVTGAQCLAACALAPGTVADGLVATIGPSPAVVRIEHPVGQLEVTVDYALDGNTLDFRSAGLVRTARMIARGAVMIPQADQA